MDIRFIEAVKDEDVALVADTASQIWHEYFPVIISAGQIDYMVEKFQSYVSLKKQIDEGYQYFLICDGDAVLGYVGIHCESERLFLSKLYLKESFRGKGIFHSMLAYCEEIARKKGLSSLYLTVNRGNIHAVSVYQKKGFRILAEQKTDIGEGFFMDDYLMEKSLEQETEINDSASAQT